MAEPTKADRFRLRRFDRGRQAIKVKWIQEYVRRGWIGSELIQFPGGCQMAPHRLTDEGRLVAYGAKTT